MAEEGLSGEEICRQLTETKFDSSIYIMVDGTYLLYFNPAYLVKLRQGTYTYTLLGEDHRPMAVFSVEIIR